MRADTRGGFGVLFALFAVVLFGALAATLVFASALETGATVAGSAARRSLVAAEAAVWNTISSFDWNAALSFLPGQSARFQVAVGKSTANVYLVRLDSTCFLVQAEAGEGADAVENARFLRRVGVTIEVTRDSAGVIRALRIPERAWTELFQP